MKIEYQVCSLELSQKLKDLGVPQESLFYWTPDFNNDFDLIYGEPTSGWQRKGARVSAFTVAELGEILGQNYDSIRPCNAGFEISRFVKNNEKEYCKGKTMAECMAKMLIYWKINFYEQNTTNN